MVRLSNHLSDFPAQRLAPGQILSWFHPLACRVLIRVEIISSFNLTIFLPDALMLFHADDPSVSVDSDCLTWSDLAMHYASDIQTKLRQKPFS